LYDGTKAAVSISLEHARSSQLTAINNEMTDMSGTVAPVVQRIGTSGHMTLQQLLDLQNRGFEIASHSETHSDISSSTSASKLYYETVQSKLDLEKMGFKVSGFIPPSNKMTTASFDLIKNNYGWTQFYSPIPYQPKYTSLDSLNYSKQTYGIYDEHSWGVGNGYTLKSFSDVKNQIDYAIANKLWIAFKFHDLVTTTGTYDTSPATFHSIIQYIREQRDAGNLLVVTKAEGIGLGNITPPNTIPTTSASPLGNTYEFAQSVTLTANEPAIIYYATDGSIPNTSSTVYSVPIVISSTTTLKFFAVDADGGTESVKTQVYTIGLPPPPNTMPTTSASPLGSTYSTPQSVTLTANEPATIYYTTDGSIPNTSSTIYSVPIVISSTTTLKFFAVDIDGNIESFQTEVYTIVSDFPVTHMSDTTASTGQNAYSARPIHAEYVSPTSQLIGDDISSITIKLKKSGSPTGTAEIGILNSDLTVKKLFETKDVSKLTTSYTDYAFSLPAGQTYKIQSGDRIGIKYIGGNSSNNISIMRDTNTSDPFDGTNSYHVYYATSWTSFTSNDLYMKLIQSSPATPG
jgi:hypothetical protein